MNDRESNKNYPKAAPVVFREVTTSAQVRSALVKSISQITFVVSV